MIGIIGASGFIGRSLAEHMAGENIPYNAYVRSPQLIENNAFSGDHRLIGFEIGGDMDMSVFDGIETLVLSTSATKPNMQYNGLVNEVQKNVLPHCQLFTELLKTDVKHIIFLSSGGTIYGNVDQATPITEDMPRMPCSPYGYGKLCIESALENIWVGQERRYTIIRASNPVGFYQLASLGAHGLVTTTFYKILNDETISIFGDGTTVRDYFSVHDLTALILRISNHSYAESTIINASSGKGLSINEVVDACATVLGKTPKIAQDLKKQPAIQYNVLSNDKAKQLFGWSPQLEIEEIIQELNTRVHRGHGS
jgi:UDP-glucose 4-epimerase